MNERDQTEQQIQTGRAADSDRHQIQTADLDSEFRQTADSDRQHYPDKQGKTRQHPMQNQAKSNETKQMRSQM
ncbi:hypothetical protein Tco_0573119 [Tanacetum coccineum]